MFMETLFLALAISSPPENCDISAYPYQNLKSIIESNDNAIICLNEGTYYINETILINDNTTITGLTNQRDLYIVEFTDYSHLNNMPVFANSNHVSWGPDPQSVSSQAIKNTNISISNVTILHGSSAVLLRGVVGGTINNIHADHQGEMSIAIKNSRSITISESQFENMGASDSGAPGSAAIWSDWNEYIYIENNVANGSPPANGLMGEGGIEFYDSNWAWVSYNTTNDTGVSPFYIVRSDNINLHHNTINNCHGWCFDIVQGSNNIDVWQNTINQTGYGSFVIADSSYDVSILYNTVPPSLWSNAQGWHPAGSCPGVNIDSSTVNLSDITVTGSGGIC